MSQHERVRVGQIGVGGFGRRRRELLRESGLFELLAAYDRSPEALAEAQREDGAEPVESYEQLLDWPGLEAVIISTGAKFHAEQVLQAAERGLHVFVEKPLCATREELERILEAQRRNGVVIGVGHADHRSDPASELIRRKIAEGELGTVAACEATTCHAGGQAINEGDWRNDPERNPGGMLFQCGVHSIHELLHLFGPVAEVQAMFRDDVLPTHTTDVAVCHLRFATGVLASLQAYHTSPYRHTLSIFGTRVNLYRFEHFFHEGTELFQQTQGPSRDAWQPREPVTLPETASKDGAVRRFHRAIRAGEAMYPDVLDAAQVMAVVFAAEASAQSGQRITLSEPTAAPQR